MFKIANNSQNLLKESWESELTDPNDCKGDSSLGLYVMRQNCRALKNIITNENSINLQNLTFA